jgi:hypothetical protein
MFGIVRATKTALSDSAFGRASRPMGGPRRNGEPVVGGDPPEDRAGGAAAGPLSGPGWNALAQLAWAQVSGLPGAALSLPELLREMAGRTLAIPAHRRRPPAPALVLRVLGRLVRAEPDMREAYLSLLAAAADRATADGVHPAFIEVIRQLTRDELRILAVLDPVEPAPVLSVSSRLRHGGGSRVELRNFSLLGDRAGCRASGRTPAYLDNLARLGLVELRPTRVTDDVRMFEEVEAHSDVVAARAAIEARPPVRVGPLTEAIVADVSYKSLFLTAFGRQFREVAFYRPQPEPAQLTGRPQTPSRDGAG